MAEPILLTLILLLAVYLRFTTLDHNPGWYTDEATHLDIARNLVHGRVQYMAIGESMLLFARPPLFHLTLAGLFDLFGATLVTLRGYTAALGVLCVGLTYGITRLAHGRAVLALLAALFLAVYPNAIIYHRFGFSYNLLTPLILLAFAALWRYLETRRRAFLAAAALLVGLGVLVDIPGGAFAVPLVVAVLLARPRDLLLALPLIALPFGIYAGLMLLTVPEAFLFDLNFTLGRLGGLPLLDQLINVVRNLTMFIGGDAWLLIGVIGLFLLNPKRLRALALCFFLLPIVVMGRTAALYSLSFYYALPLLPFAALGMVGFVCAAVENIKGLTQGLERETANLREEVEPPTDSPEGVEPKGRYALWQVAFFENARFKSLLSFVLIAFLLIAPFLFVLAQTIAQVQTQLQTAIDPFLINPTDAQSVAAFIDTCATPDDLVLASPGVAWALDARAVDFQFAVAITGEDAVHLPGSTPRERYLFDTRLESARYVILDNLWRNWGAVHIPGALRILLTVEAEWALVMQSGALAVYANPNTPQMNPVNISPNSSDDCFPLQNQP